MTIREFVEKFNFRESAELTFITAKIKDADQPTRYFEYKTTPIYSIFEWAKTPFYDDIILNSEQAPIDWNSSGKGWSNHFKGGSLRCFLTISKEDLEAYYPSQAEGIIKNCEQRILLDEEARQREMGEKYNQYYR